jgi:hypothetical protein
MGRNRLRRFHRPDDSSDITATELLVDGGFAQA